MNLERRARAYLISIEEARGFDELAPFFHPDIVLVEHPNRLVPDGKSRGFQDVRTADLSGPEGSQVTAVPRRERHRCRDERGPRGRLGENAPRAPSGS